MGVYVVSYSQKESHYTIVLSYGICFYLIEKFYLSNGFLAVSKNRNEME